MIPYTARNNSFFNEYKIDHTKRKKKHTIGYWRFMTDKQVNKIDLANQRFKNLLVKYFMKSHLMKEDQIKELKHLSIFFNGIDN